jgi:putative DNA methylase
MIWDFAEANPFAGASGDVRENLERAAIVIERAAGVPRRCEVQRTSATQLPDHDGTYDAVITDPPYYDNISYADLSDFFYVWLKRSVGFLFPEHLAGDLTPKRREIVVAPYRHDGDKNEARHFYEQEMEGCFREAHRVLKADGPLVCVYAHKTTLGWASLVEAFRRAGFTITEAWPLDTEMPRALKARTASLASSIFVVARRREREDVGDYGDVVSELESIIGERLDRLTEAGVSGSDLVIATIGAGLRAFTRYAQVELPNGEDVPAQDFLEEVQSRVLNAVLAKIHGLADGVGTIDAHTRYYVISRFSFGYAEVEFDEANNLARSAGIELSELAESKTPLVQIRKDKVHFLDHLERGEEPDLGLATNGGNAPLIDVLHGVLWRAGHRRDELGDYLVQAHFDPAALRLVAQALQGKALRAEGESKPAEAQACERLLGAWKTLIDDNLLTRQ